MLHSWFSRLAIVLALQIAVIAALSTKRNQHEASNSSGAVASESAVCSKIGIDLIKKGGNAADAVGRSQHPVGASGSKL